MSRVPLAVPIGSRTNSLTQDSKIVNAYTETQGQTKYVIKRPGLASYSTNLPTSTTCIVGIAICGGSIVGGVYGQGLYACNGNGVLYAAVKNSLYNATTGANIGSITSGIYSFTETENVPYMFLHNGTDAYNYNATTNTFRHLVPGSGFVPGTITTTGTAPNEVITAVAVSNGGSGYFSNNIQMLVNDTTGTGAILTPVINPVTGAITSLTVTAGGGSYTSPTVTAYDAGAISFPTNQVAGTLIGITLINGGSGYSSTPTVTITDSTGSGAFVNAVVVGGIITGFVINAVGSGYTNPTITITDSTGINASAVATISMATTPTLASGTVYLDNTMYVMTNTGRIYGSRVEDSTTWDALNFISKTSEPDGGVAIVKHSLYLLAFGKWSGEYFYDNGNSSGSPLARNDIAKMEIGCAAGNTVVQCKQGETVVWVGQSRSTGRGVYELQGTKAVRVSTRAIESFINADSLTNSLAWTFTIEGSIFYVLQLRDTGYTFVYSLREKEWYNWTSFTGTTEPYFKPIFFATQNNTSYVLSDDGIVHTLSTSNYQDDGSNSINYRIITPKIDGGSLNKKFWNQVKLIGDTVSATAQVSHTGDDYNTWSYTRNMDLSQKMPILYNCGRDERRAYQILIQANQPIRLEAMEAEITEGIR